MSQSNTNLNVRKKPSKAKLAVAFCIMLVVASFGRVTFDETLARSAAYGHVTTVKALLRIGADPNTPWAISGDALVLASDYGQLDIVKRLLKAGANPNIQVDVDSPAIQRAVFRGHAEVVRQLLTYGADPNLNDGSPESNLSMAEEQCRNWPDSKEYPQIVVLLRKAGATK